MPLAQAEYEAIGEWESESEAAERAPFRRPSSQPSFKPRPAPSTPMYVTQPQLESALTRVDGKIKTITDSAATINTKVTALAASFKKEAEERKKAVEGQSKDLNQKLQLLALLPLLIKSPSASGPKVGTNPLTDANGITIQAVSVPDTSNLDAILPLLLISGLGSASSSGFSLGGDGSGGDNSLLLLALVLAFAK